MQIRTAQETIIFETHGSFAKKKNKINFNGPIHTCLNLSSTENQYAISIIFHIVITFGCYRLNTFNFWQATLRCKKLRWTGAWDRDCVPQLIVEKVDDHCARIPRAVKNDECAHDIQQWTIPDRCLRPQVQTLCALIAILYLRLVKSRRYHDIILRGLFLPRVYFFSRTFISTRGCIPFFFRIADSNATPIRFITMVRPH